MTAGIRTRLQDLERRFHRGKCRTCLDHPVRIVGVDEESDAMLSETFPESGCSDCGLPIASTLEIVGIDVMKI